VFSTGALLPLRIFLFGHSWVQRRT